jgi:hypothetical protein
VNLQQASAARTMYRVLYCTYISVNFGYYELRCAIVLRTDFLDNGIVYMIILVAIYKLKIGVQWDC